MWEHAAFVFLGLGYITQFNIFSCICLSSNLMISLFLYSWIDFHYMYHIFIIDLTMEGHLDCLYFLVIVNIVSMNNYEQTFVE